MKIIATDNNYLTTSPAPAWFLLTHSCLLRDDKPMYIPEWDSDFRLFPSMAIRIDRLGKSIPERFAYRYWNHYSFGFSLRACSTLQKLFSDNMPAGSATAFDNSVTISAWHEADKESLHNIEFSITDGESELCRWRYADLALGADALLSQLSERMTFKTGDILYLGFSPSGIQLKQGMKIIVNELTTNSNDTISRTFCGFNIK